ncbi:MAG: PCYCGC domain-containing protein [Acidobacteriota bacterium]|nr:PCYCGC domain-containing protein [Acidobacteriota bacterium]
MKTKFLLIIIAILALGAGTLMMLKPGGGDTEIAQEHGGPTVDAPSTAPDTDTPPKPRVPAYQLASELGNLPPTLPASEFFGKAREAYEVAKKIPETLAQLPCYCHCDQVGHKSLHTCFVDDHAAHCAVCVDEALLAYQLQKNNKLTPEQVREKIIEKYSVENHRH